MGVDAPSDRSALIARLESFVEFPGTIPVFDVLSEPDAEDLAARVAAVFSRFPAHPLGPDLRAWLIANGQAPPEPDVLAVLEELGISDVRQWVNQQRRERQELERAVVEAREGRLSATLAANGYSLVCVLLFAVALLGWSAAFHVWSFVPEGPLPGPASSPKKTDTPAAVPPG